MPDRFIDDFKPFRLTTNFLEKYKNIEPPFGFNGLGYFTYMRTYSRIKDDGTNEKWHETIARVVNGTYNMQKKWIMGNRLEWNEWKAQSSAQEMFDRMFNMKFLPPGRGLWAMGTLITEEKGLYAALNNPLHIDTPILTKEYGWISLGEIKEEKITILSNTKLYGRDNSTAANSIWVEATVSDIEHHPSFELTYQSKWGDSYTIISSENHRWFRKKHTNSKWERVNCNELNTGDWLPRTKPPKYYKISPQGFQHGFFFGDGTRSNGELHQFGDENIDILTQLFINVENSKPTENGVIHKVVRQCPIAWGNVPTGDYIKDMRYVYGFLAGYFAADGYLNKSGNMSISSARLGELEQIKQLFNLVGVRTKDVVLSNVTDGFKKDRKLYKIDIDMTDLSEDFFIKEKHLNLFKTKNDNKQQDWLQLVSIKKLDEDQPVKCVTVPKYEQFVIDGFCLTSNCAFTSTKNLKQDLSKSFTFLMDASMLGVGVGFDTKGAGQLVIKGLNLEKESIIFVIPDTREGWVESVKLLLDTHFTGGAVLTFDYSEVRAYGEPIKGFGGVSSGPDPLKQLHNDINNVLNPLKDKEITVRAIVDIFNFIGKAVVAGNVRRTAEIAIGEPQDTEYLNLKNYDINPERADYGWTSNNSIFAELGMDYTEAAERTWHNGEPGYIWLENMRGYSRIKNGKDNKDHRVDGTNPCVEQSLESGELCCLVESFPLRHDDMQDYLRTLKFAYLYAKTVTLGQTHWPDTNRVMLRNRRIGCSASGIAQFITKYGIDELRKWLENGYDILQDWDRAYSDWFAIPRSIKLSSVKPSGTVSLLAGATPGVHYPESRFYIRRVRLSKKSPLRKPIKKAGFTIEDDVSDPSSIVVEFPVDVGEGIRTVGEVSMWEQLSLAAFMQRHWADNQVSCTVTFDPNTEGKNIANELNYFQYQLKGISFLPKSDIGAFPQMPYEEITEDVYNKKVKKLKALNFDEVTGNKADVEKWCNTDTCEIDMDAARAQFEFSNKE